MCVLLAFAYKNYYRTTVRIGNGTSHCPKRTQAHDLLIAPNVEERINIVREEHFSLLLVLSDFLGDFQLSGTNFNTLLVQS